jgi:hypothetical protein
MTARDDVQKLVNTILIEIEKINGEGDTIPIVPGNGIKQKNVSSVQAGKFGFLPLTEEEKKEFMNSLDAKGKQMLAELAGEATRSTDPEPLNTLTPTTGF